MTSNIQESAGTVFNSIYKDSKWGYKSGSGSDPKNAGPWIDLVNQYLNREDITTVLDVGCGDGRLMKHYDLEGKQYLGVDASSEIINQNIESENVHFIVGDAVAMDIPKSDLIIIKDVLQHLPIDYIQRIVPKLTSKAKVVLFCNDVCAINTNIEIGGYRGIDLLAPPFDFDFTFIFDFTSNVHRKRVYKYEKETHV